MLTDPRTDSRIVELTTWDEGYQQILCDLILQQVTKATYCSLLVVEVRCCNVAEHRGELEEQVWCHVPATPELVAAGFSWGR